ncbi:haloacid dehalogenase-like hydrolase [Actinopolymorpha sp. B9G3]|uniref:HAD family hydrolase n=1 Tax=Actinopolymorpha sp. B9G3 TaxID=3158970 RepID=UPI0032D9A2D3
MWLVLWDIDHTLIATRGVGQELSAIAFEQVTGRQMVTQAKVDGITEPVIFRETARLHGLSTSRADFERFAAALTQLHVDRALELRQRGQALVGAAAALDALAAQPQVTQTVLTGNVRGVAEVKLAAFGLDRHIEWELGAYGEDADVRTELVTIALERASAAAGRRITPAGALIIGDTTADVEAGRRSGVRVIAVATGSSSADELREVGAGAVLPNLLDTDLLVELILSDNAHLGRDGRPCH